MLTAIRDKTFRRIQFRIFQLFLFGACLYCPASPSHAQQNGVLYTFWPYDGSSFALDFTKIAYGSTPAEVCAQRNEFELTLGGGLSGSDHLIFLGLLSNGGDCGFRWVNPQGGAVITQSDFFPQFATCQDINAFDSRIPRPPTPQCFRNDPPKNGGCGCCESGGSGGGAAGGAGGGPHASSLSPPSQPVPAQKYTLQPILLPLSQTGPTVQLVATVVSLWMPRVAPRLPL